MTKHFYYYVSCRTCEATLLLKYIGEFEEGHKVEPRIVHSQTLTIPCPHCNTKADYTMKDVKGGYASFPPPANWTELLKLP